MCSFCNQYAITSHLQQPTEEDIDSAVHTAVKTMGDGLQSSEIAFFGGSFTAIKREYMELLLKAAYKHVERGTVRGIRISTRPDAINSEILGILSRYGVTTVELGAQSMLDSVLKANRRGHTANDVRNAASLIKSSGIALGLQMMTGLYTDTDDGAIYTANEFISLQPSCVRIYPTVVLEGTQLADYYRSGIYTPQTVEQAVELCARLLIMFRSHSIPVIRLGLHAVNEQEVVAGAWHSSFGELCESRIILDRLRALTERGKSYTVYVSPRNLSKTIGNKKTNLLTLNKEGVAIKVVADSSLSGNEFSVKEVNLIEA